MGAKNHVLYDVQIPLCNGGNFKGEKGRPLESIGALCSQLCKEEGQHPLTAQRTANFIFNSSICSLHVCICFMIYNGSEFAAFRL